MSSTIASVVRIYLAVVLILTSSSFCMSQDNLTSFSSGGKTFEITFHKAVDDGKRHPLVVVLHGNAGLNGEFGIEIHKSAKAIALKAIMSPYRDTTPIIIRISLTQHQSPRFLLTPLLNAKKL